jgi:hypothetical protein
VVLSDMQFDRSINHDNGYNTTWESTYQRIVANAEALGYKGYEPRIVFWNLDVSVDEGMPAPADAKGVIQISGYSVSVMMAVLGQTSDMYDVARRHAEEMSEAYLHRDARRKTAEMASAQKQIENSILCNRAYEGIVVEQKTCRKGAYMGSTAAQKVLAIRKELLFAESHRSRPTLLKKLRRKLARAEYFASSV